MEEFKPRSTVLRQAIDRSGEPKPSRDAMLTVREACEYLRISKWTLYRFIQAGKLSSVKLGRRRLIRMQSIQEFINRQEAETEV